MPAPLAAPAAPSVSYNSIVAPLTLELYDTDGAAGAAKGAGIGAGIYKDNEEAFASLQKLAVIEPEVEIRAQYREAYERWLAFLKK